MNRIGRILGKFVWTLPEQISTLLPVWHWFHATLICTSDTIFAPWLVPRQVRGIEIRQKTFEKKTVSFFNSILIWKIHFNICDLCNKPSHHPLQKIRRNASYDIKIQRLKIFNASGCFSALFVFILKEFLQSWFWRSLVVNLVRGSRRPPPLPRLLSIGISNFLSVVQRVYNLLLVMLWTDNFRISDSKYHSFWSFASEIIVSLHTRSVRDYLRCNSTFQLPEFS